MQGACGILFVLLRPTNYAIIFLSPCQEWLLLRGKQVRDNALNVSSKVISIALMLGVRLFFFSFFPPSSSSSSSSFAKGYTETTKVVHRETRIEFYFWRSNSKTISKREKGETWRIRKKGEREKRRRIQRVKRSWKYF